MWLSFISLRCATSSHVSNGCFNHIFHGISPSICGNLFDSAGRPYMFNSTFGELPFEAHEDVGAPWRLVEPVRAIDEG